MGEVVPARTLPILDPPSPPTVHQLSQLALWELNIYHLRHQSITQLYKWLWAVNSWNVLFLEGLMNGGICAMTTYSSRRSRMSKQMNMHIFVLYFSPGLLGEWGNKVSILTHIHSNTPLTKIKHGYSQSPGWKATSHVSDLTICKLKEGNVHNDEWPYWVGPGLFHEDLSSIIRTNTVGYSQSQLSTCLICSFLGRGGGGGGFE